MKNKPYLLLMLLLFISCNQNKREIQLAKQEVFSEEEMDADVQKFEIIADFIQFSTLVNDSIQAEAILETGCGELCVNMAFFDRYLNKGQKKEVKLLQFGFASNDKKDTTYIVKSSPIKIKIANSYLIFHSYRLLDFKKKNIKGDLIFPIPFKDSLFVWELNMEKQYIKLHDYTENMTFNNYHSTNIYSNEYQGNKILFDLPIKYLTSDKIEQDTLFCLFDTGYPLDVFLWNSLNVIQKIENQKLSNGITNKGYVKIFRTETSFFNFNIQDIASIRFEENPQNVPVFDIVGLNFMVRFNYFIDIHNMKLYYKYIEHPQHFYSREGYDIGGGYGHYDLELNLVVDSIGKKHANDACARAGVRDRDTIIWYCGYSVKEQTEKLMDFRDVLHEYDCYHYRVKRNGDTLDLKINKNF